MRRAREPVARQLATHLLVDLRERILGARPEAPRQVRGHASEERHQRQHERHAELFPVGVADVQPLEQPALLSLAEGDDLVVPERVRGIPGEAHLREQRVLAQEPAGQRLAALRERRFEPALDTLRSDGGRWIDAHPAAPFEPHLRPCVRLRLADQQIAAHRVVLAALVAGDHARRDAGGARQHRERGREVLAESAARVEQEIVDGVQLQPRRLERVEVFLVAKLGEHRCDECLVAPGALAHFAGECDRALVAAGGQPRVHGAHQVGQGRADGVRRRGFEAEGRQRGDRTVEPRQQLQDRRRGRCAAAASASARPVRRPSAADAARSSSRTRTSCRWWRSSAPRTQCAAGATCGRRSRAAPVRASSARARAAAGR